MPARRLPFLHYCHSLLPITINRNRTQQPRRTNELAPHTHPPWHFPHPVTFCTTSNFTNLFGTNYYYFYDLTWNSSNARSKAKAPSVPSKWIIQPQSHNAIHPSPVVTMAKHPPWPWMDMPQEWIWARP